MGTFLGGIEDVRLDGVRLLMALDECGC